MKKIMTMAASLAIVACFASCQKENNIENGGYGKNSKATTITATFADQTKVTYEEEGVNLQPKWEIGDEVLGIDSSNKVFALEVASVNDNVATLVASEDGEIPSGDVLLLYFHDDIPLLSADIDNAEIVMGFNDQNGSVSGMSAIMAAKGTITDGNGMFVFENSCSILGIFDVGEELKDKSIKQVTLFGENLASAVTINSAGVTFNEPIGKYNVISTGILSDITVGTDGKLGDPILMAVPAGAEIDSVFIRTTEGEVYSLGSSNEKKAMDAGEYRYIKGATFRRVAYRDDMILTGVFSVSATKQVFFSKGNLWYGKVGDAQTATFNFEDNQNGYSYILSEELGREVWDPDHVSHFLWSKDASKACAEFFSDSERSTTDVFFTNATEETANPDFTVNGVTGKYRTLSAAEWQYLLAWNPELNDSEGGFDENMPRYGLFYQYYYITTGEFAYYSALLPDNYFRDTDDFDIEYAMVRGSTEGFFVCLPYAGYRYRGWVDSATSGKYASYVSDIGKYFEYWSSSALKDGMEYAVDGAFCMFFRGLDDCSIGNVRDSGLSVRLVVDCE